MSQYSAKEMCLNLRTVKDNCPAIRNVMEYSLFQKIGDVRGKDVLEFGCGDGTNLRILKKKGANKTAGFDISPSMIELAQDEEKARPLGIDYRVADGRALGKIGEFDLIFAAVVLSYAETEDDLAAMFRSIYDNLKPGGRFVNVDMNNFSTDWFDNAAKFNRKLEVELETPTCRQIQVWWQIDKFTTFEPYLYHYKRHVYDSIFEEIGFRSVKWENVVVSDDAKTSKFGEKFWADYMKNPEFKLLVAVK